MNQGWIKIHRKIKDHWLYSSNEPYTQREAWLDLLLEVNFEAGKMMLEGKIYECGSGQSLKSLEAWTDRWKWSRSRVYRFFQLLEKDEMIHFEKLTYRLRRLTICNWENYQANREPSETTIKPIEQFFKQPVKQLMPRESESYEDQRNNSETKCEQSAERFSEQDAEQHSPRESTSYEDQRTISETTFERSAKQSAKTIKEYKEERNSLCVNARTREETDFKNSNIYSESENTKKEISAAANDDPPEWTAIALEMADYFKTDPAGKNQWALMAETAGFQAEPIVITTIWAGKHQDSPWILRNWKNHTGKLVTWMMNVSRTNQINQTKTKSFKNGKANDHLVTPGQLERVFTQLEEEGY